MDIACYDDGIQADELLHYSHVECSGSVSTCEIMGSRADGLLKNF